MNLNKRITYPENVHGYEYLIKEKYEQCLDKDLTSCQSFEQCIDQMIEMIKNAQCDIKLKNEALISIELIKTKNQNNHDQTNSIHIESLLPRVWNIIQNYEDSGKLVFIEQLADILGGTCAQGRSIRLVQFYINHYS